MGTRSTRLAALSGVAFVVFLVPSVLLTMGSPSTSATAAKVQTYFLAHHGKYGGAAFLTVFAVLFAMFFFGYLRAYFRKHAGMEWLSSIFFGGAILLAASGGVGAGIDSLIADHPAAESASSLQLINALQSNLNYPMTCVGLAVLYFAAGFIIYRSKALPAWLAWVSWILGLVSASFFLGFFGLVAMAPWALIISIMLASRNPSLEPGDSVAGVSAPSPTATSA